jgi:prevent-host-death family protein
VKRTLTQRELRNRSGEIMRRLDAGERFVVTRDGTPVASLTPLRRDVFVRADAVLETFRGAPAVDLGGLRDDLDAVADPDATPRG